MSGAGTFCLTRVGLDLYGEVVTLENLLKAVDSPPLNSLSLLPASLSLSLSLSLTHTHTHTHTNSKGSQTP